MDIASQMCTQTITPDDKESHEMPKLRQTKRNVAPLRAPLVFLLIMGLIIGQVDATANQVEDQDCLDKDDRCLRFIQLGECEKSPYIMKKKCKKSCGFCSVEAKEKSGRVGGSTKDNLRDAGVSTTADCVDKDSRCAKLAQMGECEKSPYMMKTRCKKSCNFCSESNEKEEAARTLLEENKLHRDNSDGSSARDEDQQLCTDNDSRCEKLAKMGECEKSPFLMKKKCKKSCKLCSPKEESKEAIPVPVPVPVISRESRYQPEISSRSSSSSNDEEECNDKDSRCVKLAQMGECERSPYLMRSKCKKSCNYCPQSTSTNNVLPGSGSGENTSTEPSIVPNEPGTDCVDKDNRCARLAQIGECEKSPYIMKNKCPKSCSLCSSTEHKQEGEHPTKEWNRGKQDESSPPAEAEMESRFDCADEDEKCYKLVQAGECEKIPYIMKMHCKKSCGFCSSKRPKEKSNSGTSDGRQILEKSFGDKQYFTNENAQKTRSFNSGNGPRRENLLPGSLRPRDLPKPVIFSDFKHNRTIHLPFGSQVVASGAIAQIGNDASHRAQFDVLPNLVDRESVRSILEIVQSYNQSEFDDDPDSVDGMPTYEIFERGGQKKPDKDPRKFNERKPIREKLRQITQPLLDERIIPFVRERYPEVCDRGDGRKCTPCDTLIRRYRYGERQSHEMHNDADAIVTCVVSLADHGKEYNGGLYVSTKNSEREYLALSRGDAVVHQSTLMHGVKVLELEDRPEETERWSWIIWFRDSESCEKKYSDEWFEDCAQKGNPTCMNLYAGQVFERETPIDPMQRTILALEWMEKAARRGCGRSATKFAKAHLGIIKTPLEVDEQKAMRYLQLAIASTNEPDAHYTIAQWALRMMSIHEENPSFTTWDALPEKVREHRKSYLPRAVLHLEEAALTGHRFSMYNLGNAHLYGYGTVIDLEKAVEWFTASDLPEGYFAASLILSHIGRHSEAAALEKRAKILGYGQSWRKEQRALTGNGIDLDIPWPLSDDGRRPLPL